MAQMTIYPSSGPIASKSGNPHIILDYSIANGSFTVNSITGYRSSYSNWDAVNKATVTISVPGGSITLYSTTGTSWSDGVGYRSSGFTWSLTGNRTISTSGTGNVSVSVSGTSSSSGCDGVFSGSNVEIPPAFVANALHSQSVNIAAYIPYLKVSTYSNATYNGHETLGRQVELNPSSGGDDTFLNGYGTANTSGEAWGTLTVTGQELNTKGLLGTKVRGNNEIFYINGAALDYYSSDFTPPSNLMSDPSITAAPEVLEVAPTYISIKAPQVTWIRSESQAFYSYCLGNEGSGLFYQQYKQSPMYPANKILKLYEEQNGGTRNEDPGSETVSDGEWYSYKFQSRQTAKIYTYAITKFLGVRKVVQGPTVSIYIPQQIDFQKNGTSAYQYQWVNKDGKLYYQLKETSHLFDKGFENVGPRYTSMNNTKVPVSQVWYLAGGTGENWVTDLDNANNELAYTNSAVTATAHSWLYYATNRYAESKIVPHETKDNVSLAANLLNVAISNVEIDLLGKIKVKNVKFNTPRTALPVGTMTATIQLSKSNTFNSITHQATKTVTGWGDLGKLFDDIELEGSDLGWNYVRVKWNLHSSSNYYEFADTYSNTLSIEFTGIIPEIDEFTGYVDYASGKIKCKIKESTGIPKPKLYLDVYRISGGGVYQSFEVVNDTEYTLPYTEPGTIWYIRARAVNALGTVYALDDSNNVIEYTYQIPYTTTEDYDSIANPTLSAGKILYNQNCTMNFNWTNIVTDVDHVQYNIKMRSSNVPITPVDHTDKISGYNYTFTNRIDDEKVMYVLEVVLLNSFNEAVVTYLIDSNEITLDALDLGWIGYTYNTETTYHSIKYILDTFDKNITAIGNDNKLVNMYVGLLQNNAEFTVPSIIDLSEHILTSSGGLQSVKNADGSITTKGTPDTNYTLITPKVNIDSLLEDGQIYTAGMKDINDFLYIVVNITHKDGSLPTFARIPAWNHYQFVVDKTNFSYSIEIHSSLKNNWSSYKEITNFYYLIKGIPLNALIGEEFIGDWKPTIHSFDLNPIDNVLFENLKANTKYNLLISATGMNPLDASKKHTVYTTAIVTTKEFNIHPVKNVQVNITKQIQNKPTANSNVELKWDIPDKGDADVVDYIVSYRKNSVPYTDIIVVEKQYTLAHEIVPINNDDEIYIKIGARYLDWFGNYQTKWVTLPVITAASTNYIYYECSYPNVEQSKRRMYKIAETQTSESLVRNVHINK